MKAIIMAAGQGSRLMPITNNKPKCMFGIKGKTILQHQLDAFHANSITDISAIKGYKKDAINYLFYTEKEMDDEFIASYSDMTFSDILVRRVIESGRDIAIAADIDWKSYYEGRSEHPIGEAEKVIFDFEKNVVKIGKIINNEEDVNGEFIGMLKYTKKGADIFKKYFHKANT